MRIRFIGLVLGCISLFCFTSSLLLQAQTASTGALTVTVTDPSGRAISGAGITITSQTGQSRTSKTNTTGSYTFSLLPIDTYQLTISAEGFRTEVLPAIALNVTETKVVNQVLQVGTQTQAVTVTAAAEALQTESSALGGVVGQQAILEIPSATRNYTQIIGLSPGVISNVNDASQVGRGSQNAFVNGTGNDSSNYQMDGVDITNYNSNGVVDPFGGLYGSPPIVSPDALQEFKVQTSLYDASYGHSGGANVNIVTKSGTNKFHGSLFEFVRNDIFNANGYFQNATGKPRGELKQNQFGGTIGGPIFKDKMFFFFSYQGTRQVNGVALQGFQTVSLPAQLTNNRTASVLGAEFCPANNPVGSPGAKYAYTYLGSTSAKDEVACNGSNINPIALALLNAKLPNGQFVIPSPQQILNPGTANAVGFSSFSVPATFNEDQGLLNLDYILSPKHTLSERFFYAYGLQTNPFDVAGQPPGGGLTNLSGNILTNTKLTSIITNNLVNEARFSWYYTLSNNRGSDPITTTEIGVTPAASYWTVFPIVSITGLFSFGGQFSDTAKFPPAVSEWADQLSWNHGRHTIRTGFDEEYVRMTLRAYGRTRGTLTFQTWPDLLLGMSAAQNGTAQSNIYSAAGTLQSVQGSPGFVRENYIAGFIQDDFKQSAQLTWNLGLRWEYNGMPYDVNPANDGLNPDYNEFLKTPVPPATGTYTGYTAGTIIGTPLPPGIPQRGNQLPTGKHAPFTNFAPRLGFAWQPLDKSGRLVVRGGVAVFYVNISGNIAGTGTGANFPNAGPYSATAASNALSTWSVPFNPAPQLGFSQRFPNSAIFAGYGTDPKFVPSTIVSEALNIQYEIKPSLVLEIGYLGNRGIHLIANSPRNIPQLASPTNPVNCGFPSGCITANTTSGANSPSNRTPVLGLAPYGLNDFVSSFGDSEYSSVQASLRKAFSHGLEFQTSYTYGRTFTDINGADDTAGVSLNSNDPNNHAQMHGPADNDRPQRLVVNYTYTLPYFSDSKGFTGKALGGWGVSGVTVAQSGNPLTITNSAGGAAYQSTASRAQLCPGMTKANIYTSGSIVQRLTGYFNKSAFCSVPVVPFNGGDPNATGFGNTPRGIAMGPGQFNWDISATKKTVVGGINESAYLEFRSEFYNAFNHPQFSNPAANSAGATFGSITSTTVGPRIIQFGLKYIF